MRMNEILRHGRHLLRAELLVAEIRFRARARRLVLLVAAAAPGLLAVVMVNIAVYEWLLSSWGPVWTPLALAAADVLAAAVLVLWPASGAAGPELAVAEDLRKTVSDDLEAELRPLTDIGGLWRGAQDMGTATLLVPVITAIVRALRSKSAAAGKP